MARIPAPLLILAVIASGVLLWYARPDDQPAPANPNTASIDLLDNFDQEVFAFDSEFAQAGQLRFALDDVLRDEVPAEASAATLDEDLQSLNTFDGLVADQATNHDQTAETTLTIEEIRN